MQLFERERLDEVVVCARLEARDPFGDLAARREHDDGHVVAGGSHGADPEGARMAHILVGLGLDILSLLVLVGWLYRRRAAAPEMTMVFATLNIGLFAAVVAIGSGDFPVGVGFGLFGLLSLVR